MFTIIVEYLVIIILALIIIRLYQLDREEE